jgi:hypothetical protein
MERLLCRCLSSSRDLLPEVLQAVANAASSATPAPLIAAQSSQVSNPAAVGGCAPSGSRIIQV